MTPADASSRGFFIYKSNIMNNLSDSKIYVGNIFGSNHYNYRQLYYAYFQKLPNVIYLENINGEKASKKFIEKFGACIINIYQEVDYKPRTKKFDLDDMYVVLNNEIIIYFTLSYVYIYCANEPTEYRAYIDFITKFKERNKRNPLEINIITFNDGLCIRSMEIQRTKLDINLFYEDDFKEVDQVIQSRLNKKNDKGIVLLHGLPGTGKTTYLRYLMGKIKKRVLFISPEMANSITNPQFIQLLINNSNSVLVIEDAENIIMDRRLSSGSSVSNLLNISDGLLSDFLNIQLVCTFNHPLTMVDEALMRKGRLIARYEFGKLSKEKAQRLSNHLGHTREIDHAMTIAEITHPDAKPCVEKRERKVGFQLNYMNNN